MNAYEQYSTIERQKLEKLYQQLKITNYTFTPTNGFDKVEGTFTLAGRKCVVEAKCRKCRVKDYPSHILEQPKAAELQQWFTNGYTPLYINFFWDGVIIYNLTKRFESDSLEYYGTDLPKNTAGGAGTTSKRVAYLEFNAVLGDKRFGLKKTS